mmetsp:Transcript_28189/g.64153  ORF Transcript_28189/g.64153 Transcript_28189/m.64153 type:complete len:240 (+) Transcript_28189:1287-2006(+)
MRSRALERHPSVSTDGELDLAGDARLLTRLGSLPPALAASSLVHLAPLNARLTGSLDGRGCCGPPHGPSSLRDASGQEILEVLLLADLHLDALVLAVEEAPVGPMHLRVNALELVHCVVPPLTRPAAVPHEPASRATVLRVGGVAVRARPLDARGPGGRVGSPGGLEGGQARGRTAGRVRAPGRSRRGRRASRWRGLVALLAVVAAFLGAFIVVVALLLLIPRRPANGTGDGRRPLLVV